MIPYGRQEITDEDIKTVVEVLKSDFLTQGPAVPQFERAISKYCKTKYAVAVNSATSALHISCLALGLEKGDILWTSPISFVASANVALYCGASIDFVDIDYDTNNMSMNNLEERLKIADKENRLPKIIIPVHLAGKSCDMKRIYELSKIYGFKIIEDASHAIGGEYKNKKIGSCNYSDITVFSFHPVKIITTAEGGMAMTNNESIFNKLQLLRSHGITRNKKFMNNIDKDDWYYEQITLGYNYRMNDIQAALGLSQTSRLNIYIQRRNELARLYFKHLENLDLILPVDQDDSLSSFHLFIIKISENSKKVRDDLFNYLKKSSIGVNLHYIPIYNQPYFDKLGFNRDLFPNSEKYFKNAISIPIYPTLKDDQVFLISEKIREFL